MIIHCRFYFIDMLVFELTIMVCVATHHYSMSHGGFLFVFFCFLSLSLSLHFFHSVVVVVVVRVLLSNR